MAGFTNSKANDILKSAIPSTTYVGLSTTTPNDSGGNVSEPAASTGYSRKQIGTLDYSINKQIANKEYIFLFECLASAGTAVSVILASSASGTPFFSADLTSPLTMNAGYVPLIRPWKLKIGLDKSALDSYSGET